MQEKSFTFELGEVLLVNKPLRWTSFDIVGKIRASIGQKKLKVGHAGTLDPLADGLLIVCTGKKTKEIDQFQGLEKEYFGTLRLGATRPSDDLETEIDKTYPYDHVTQSLAEEKLNLFRGKILQVSPNYSARRVDGVRAYEKARLGETIEIKPREVEIYGFTILEFNVPEIRFKVKCSKGTYIRSLVRDLGDSLHSGAYLSQLTRTSIGSLSLKDAWEIGPLCEAIHAQNPLAKTIEPKILSENRNIKMHSQHPE